LEKTQREDARVGGIEQAQPDALAAADGELQQPLTVERDGIAETAGMGDVVPVPERLGQLAAPIDAPVIQDPDHVPVDGNRRAFLDDEGPVKPAADLLVRALVRVIPEGPRIRADELIDMPAAGRD